MDSDALIFILIFIGLAYFIVLGIGATLMSSSASDKGYGPEAHITAICFFLGIFGYLYALSLPDKTLQKQNETLINALENKKPEDSEELPDL